MKANEADSINTIPEDSLYTIKEAAGILHIHRDTLRSYTRKGLIGSTFNLAGQIRYTGAEIKRAYFGLNNLNNATDK